MNHSFIKMLQYECKANYMMWLYNLIIGVGLLTTFYFSGTTHGSAYPIFIFPIFLLLTWVFTINSYQESTKSQSMQMYHLVPISRNTKFISKQCITLLAYPLALSLLTAFLIGIIRIFVNNPDVFHNYSTSSNVSNHTSITGFNLLLIWIFGHSVSTFFAIIFKKNKIVYAFLISLGLQFVSSIAMAIYISILNLKNGDRVPTIFTNNNIGDYFVVVALLLSLVLYGISYHLFFRRQL